MSLVLWQGDHDDDLDDNDEDLDDNHDDDFDDVPWYDDHYHDFDEDANAGEGDFDGIGDEGKEQKIITNPPHQKEAQKRLSAEELEDSTAEREWTTSKVLKKELQ